MFQLDLLGQEFPWTSVIDLVSQTPLLSVPPDYDLHELPGHHFLCDLPLYLGEA